MKFFAIGLLSLVVGCGSWRKVPEFKSKMVCSMESLSYVKDNKSTYVKNNDSRVKEKMAMIEGQVKECYKDELKRDRYNKPMFNLCLVAGYDAKGKQKHFEFSSREHRMSDAMSNCLRVIKKNRGLKGLKGITFIQPYRLTPKQKKSSTY